jgi:hypothetical protein
MLDVYELIVFLYCAALSDTCRSEYQLAYVAYLTGTLDRCVSTHVRPSSVSLPVLILTSYQC